MGREGATSHPVIVVSRDPMVVLAIKAAPGRRVHLVQQSASPAGISWPGHGAYSVVLDVEPHQRRAAYEAVRRHHAGRIVVVLRPGEPSSGLPSDPDSVVVSRPFNSRGLLELLAAPPVPPGPPERAAAIGRSLAPARTPVRPARPVRTSRQIQQGRQVQPAPAAPVRPRQLATPAPGSNHPTAAGTAILVPPTPVPARRRPRGRRALAAVLVPLVVGFLGFVAWFLGGVLEAARDLGASSRAVRAKLVQVDAALAEGDVAAASAAVNRARADLGTSLGVADRRPVRMAAHVPVLSASIVDLQHLLNAAAYVVQGADRAVRVYGTFGTDRPRLLRNYRLDLSVLAQTRNDTDALLADVASARAELMKVRGGVLVPGVEGARAEALAHLETVESRIRPVVSSLRLMPKLLGLDQDRTYVVVLTNLAQSRPSGGVPEALVRLQVSDGVITLQGRPARIAQNLQDARATWRALPEDPWRPGTTFTELTYANSSPHFPTSGEELLRAYEATSGGTADGVVSVDPLALRGFLDVTGGLTVSGYGRLTSDNIATVMMRDAYKRWPDRDVRWRHNQALLMTLLQELLDGRQFLNKAKALGSEASGRHLQVYMRDGQLRQATAAAHVDGALASAPHDYLAAYTRNESESRLDLDQQREIRQRVELLGDGSAKVTRTMVIGYPAAARTGPDGSAPANRMSVALYLPPAATGATVRVNDRPTTASQEQEARRPFVRVGVTLRPGASAAVQVSYRLPSAAARTAGGLRYELVTDPQPMVRPAKLTVEVAIPEGMTARPGQDWSVLGRTATRTATLSTSLTSQLELERD